MGFNEFIGKLFGNKATRDMKEIKPWVDKIKAVYPEIAKLSNDELRAKTEELKKYIHDSATEEQKKIEELKATIETTELEDREGIFTQIDKLEKEVLEKYEKALDDVLPQAFAIVKDTARRFSENPEIEVTATEFDRNLAAQGKDFVRIEGDKAIWQNHWLAGGNDMTWGMVHYDVQLFGGVVLHKGKIAEMATGEGKTLVATLPVFLISLILTHAAEHIWPILPSVRTMSLVLTICVTIWLSARRIWCSVNIIMLLSMRSTQF